MATWSLEALMDYFDPSFEMMPGYPPDPVYGNAPDPTTYGYDPGHPLPQMNYGPPEPGTGFTLAQAQWLVQFMRNLPGGAPPQPTDAEYEQSLAAQRAQAAEMYGAEPYGQPPWGYEGQGY